MPVVALMLVCLCGFTALSVEIATLASLKVQCQNAADAAALTGSRTLNGTANSNTSQAASNAQSAASANSALGNNSAGKLALVPFSSSEVGITNGTYHYDTSSQTFYPTYTLATGENYNLVKVTAQRAVRNSFFSVDAGTNSSSVNQTVVATSIAAHRPRDIAVVLDFSGSMNNESDLWNCESYLGPYYGVSNNSDTLVPTFGHYSSSSAAIVSTLTSPGGSCNVTQVVQGTPAITDTFTQSTRASGGSTPAFTATSSSYSSSPMGDIGVTQLNTGSGTAFIQTLNNLYGSTFTTSYDPLFYFGGYGAFEKGILYNGVILQGYDYLYFVSNLYYGAPAYPTAHGGLLNIAGFSGYTTGPKYWGKTFFIWPPDPRSSKDWRQLYFTDPSNNPVVNNTTLWNASNQSWYSPHDSQTNYHINYKAILNWIVNTGTNPFPPTLRAGRTVYYSYIPTDVPAAAYDHSQPNSNITDPSQRFWKEYIDFTLGVWRDPFGNVQTPGNPSCSYGPDFNWGNVQITAKPSGNPTPGYTLGYMNYNDNPPRPRHRMWFGPMTMIQYILDTGISPGTIRDISTYSAKLGITSVLQDIQVNHPNDSVALIIYNRPQYSNEPSIGEFTQALYNLNRNYSAMTSSLWYPPNSSTADVTPWDANGSQTPAADFDFISNTATQHGMMLAYNQFSGSSTLSSAGVGGLGRNGAKRLVILETDGMANTTTSATFANNGAINSYYNILPGQSITGYGYDQNNLMQVAQSICNTSAGVAGTANSIVSNPGNPGFATASKPVQIQTIAFGIVFQISTSTQSSAVSLLQGISTIGGTTFPSSASDPTNGFKWCIGDLNTRVQLLQQAFAKVLDDGDSVSLIQ